MSMGAWPRVGMSKQNKNKLCWFSDISTSVTIYYDIPSTASKVFEISVTCPLSLFRVG